MDELILIELNETKELLQDVMNTHPEQDDNRITQMLATIESRLYSIEESMIWIKNGGKYLGDAKGSAGIPGV